MSITKGELIGRVLRVLNKTTANRGYYTAEKLHDAVREALTFVAVEMFEGGEGWQNKIRYIDVPADALSIPIPGDVGLINEVRLLVGEVYVPLVYDDAGQSEVPQPGSGASSYPGQPRYRVVDNCFYFDQTLAEAQTDGLMIEHTAYPMTPQDDMDMIDPHFDAAMMEFLKYKAASILEAGLGRKPETLPWASLEAQWYKKIVTIITRRNMQTTSIKEFCG